MGAGTDKDDNLKVPKADKSNWAKTMEAIVLHLKLIRGARGSMRIRISSR